MGDTVRMVKKAYPLLVIFILSLVISSAPSIHAEGSYPEPSIWTDEPDYAPGETLMIIGSSFKPNSAITINISRPDTVVDTINTQSNEAGNFSCYYGPLSIEGDYNVTATDGTNVAETTFTDCWVLIRMYYSADHQPFSSEVDRRGYDYLFNPGKNAYITFYMLQYNTNYRVEFWAYQNRGYQNMAQMAYTFNSGSSNKHDYVIQIPQDGPLSTDGHPWYIKIYKNNYLLSQTSFWVATIKTYKDPGMSTECNTFLPGDTIYIKGEGLKPLTWIAISYYYEGDSNPVKISGPYYIKTDTHGTFTTTYLCTGPQGEWIILVRWSCWCWCPSQHYKTESFFVVPELPFGTITAILTAFSALVLTKKRYK